MKYMYINLIMLVSVNSMYGMRVVSRRVLPMRPLLSTMIRPGSALTMPRVAIPTPIPARVLSSTLSAIGKQIANARLKLEDQQDALARCDVIYEDMTKLAREQYHKKIQDLYSDVVSYTTRKPTSTYRNDSDLRHLWNRGEWVDAQLQKSLVWALEDRECNKKFLRAQIEATKHTIAELGMQTKESSVQSEPIDWRYDPDGYDN